ncbi:putative NAD dependent epimerase/dehydratase [Lentithecium fluviatile CBS 122367]|uniref:Putative NAD dependent epimerase/dehydratase n=1 Tax=Lentithecium fluviatile CBS 122367 TaxID=1168545 RepID=A0A6G1J2G0_9PLEO|nr:putative NAD dependent epimerase/dehydratase [Lentithecium fluviatile CBS 122367]
MSPKTLFITGGSGYIGTTVIQTFLAAGYTIRALSRSDDSDTHLRSLGVTPVRGDLKSLNLLTQEASTASVVVNIADSIAREFGKILPKERFRINNAAIAALAVGMKGSGNPLILTSGSLYAKPHPQGEETDEESPGWHEGHPFSNSHELVNLKYKDDRVRVCIMRLAPYVYGRGGSGVRLFMENFAKAGRGMYVDDGSAHITTVHVEDAARLYLLLAETPTAEGIYNATSETHVTHKQLAQAIAAKIGVECDAVPYEGAKAKTGEWFATFLKSDNRAGNGKAKRLGWEVKAEKGILEDIQEGSYGEVAEELRKGMGKEAEERGA